jgi:hypothetical protein
MKKFLAVMFLTVLVGFVSVYAKPAGIPLDVVPEDVVFFGVIPKIDTAIELVNMMESGAGEQIGQMKPYINMQSPLIFFLNNVQFGFAFDEINDKDLIILIPVVSAKKKDFVKYIEKELAKEKTKELKGGVLQMGDIYAAWLPGDYLAIAPVKENIEYIKKAKPVSKSKIENAKNVTEFSGNVSETLASVYLNGKVINDMMSSPDSGGMMSQYKIDVRYAASFLNGKIDLKNYQFGGEISLSSKLYLKDGKALKQIFLMDDKTDKGVNYIPVKPIGMFELNIKPEILSLASMFAMGMTGMDLSTMGWDLISGNLAVAVYPQAGMEDFNNEDIPQILAFISTLKPKDSQILMQNFLTIMQESYPGCDLEEQKMGGDKVYQLVGMDDAAELYIVPQNTGLLIAWGKDVVGKYLNTMKQKDMTTYNAVAKKDANFYSVLNLYIKSEEIAKMLSEETPFGGMIDLRKLFLQINISKDTKVVEFKISLNQ